MTEVLYVKYNRTRRERFQIKTEIVLQDGEKKAVKAALGPEGRDHIASFPEKYRRLSILRERHWQSRSPAG